MSGNSGSQNIEASNFSMHSWYIYSTVFVGCIYNLYIKKEVNKQTSLNIVFAPVSSYQILELYVYVKRVTTYGLRFNFNRMIWWLL